jgi:hypothetical protein
MDDGGSPGLDEAPYFFLSHSHPRSRHAGPNDQHVKLVEFYQLLSAHLIALTTFNAELAPGYLDRSMRVGTIWPDALARALGACRVFVPLYSERLFESEWCGREWHAFRSRELAHLAAGGLAASAIVPVLWTGLDYVRLPDCALPIEYSDLTLDDRYKQYGLYGLRIIDDAAYQRAVLSLAFTIRHVAEITRMEPSEPPVLDRLINAFRPPTTGEGSDEP